MILQLRGEKVLYTSYTQKSVINLSGLMQFYFNILLIGWEFLGLVKNILMKLLLKEDTIQVMEEVEVMRVKLMEVEDF